ncbi:MAG TPA: ribose-phosphate pyrophosphokinase-like domain-containing protein, partial [Tissierellaceae bacterium]|nr:ribose-phosphate pyrophosphokinase-like domain-containing protein [Tissierellaceae bacterium]
MNLVTNNIRLITGNAHRELAEKIAKSLNVEMAKCEVTYFMDGEVNVNIGETVRGMDVYIIQPTCTPVNDNLMETLILIDAVKRASAG